MMKLLIVAGPSAVGKTYLADLLISKYPSKFASVKLHTTRKPRPNENALDRIFISETDFLAKKGQGEFLIAEKFHDNWYGFEKSSLVPGRKHLVVNAWPALLPRFSHISGVQFVGFNISFNNLGLLRKRMAQRGDTPDKIKERVSIIKKDVADLTSQSNLISKNGKLFIIENNETIEKDVLPWIEQNVLASEDINSSAD